MKNKTNEQIIIESKELICNLLTCTYPDWDRVQKAAAAAAIAQGKHVSEVRKQMEARK